MSQVAETKAAEGTEAEIVNMCNSLFKEWLTDLTPEEKEIWLWNASVELMRIKKRRKL